MVKSLKTIFHWLQEIRSIEMRMIGLDLGTDDRFILRKRESIGFDRNRMRANPYIIEDLSLISIRQFPKNLSGIWTRNGKRQSCRRQSRPCTFSFVVSSFSSSFEHWKEFRISVEKCSLRRELSSPQVSLLLPSSLPFQFCHMQIMYLVLSQVLK